jgi:hypothetical protein
MAIKCRFVPHRNKTRIGTGSLSLGSSMIVHRYDRLKISIAQVEHTNSVHAGDTKAGTLIGTDRWGNKYFENLAEELPC